MASEETKKLLSSVIISCPKGLTVRRLLHEYRELTGELVPFRQLGFSSFEKYLYSIPDTCRISGCGDNAIVIPIVNEKNKHINDMILKQRQPKLRNVRYSIPKRSRGIYSSNTFQKAPVPLMTIPNNFTFPVSNLKSNLMSIQPPPDYFLETHNTNISNKYSALPTSCSSKSTQVQQTTCKSNANNNLVQPESNYKTYPLQYNSQYSQQSAKSVDSTKQQCDINSTENNIKNTVQLYDINTSLIRDLNTETLSANLNDTEFVYLSEEEDVELSSLDNRLCDITLNDCEKSTSVLHSDVLEKIHVPRANDKVQAKLKLLIAAHPNGIWCSKLLKMYNEEFKQKLDPLDFGFSSVIQLCDDLPDIFYCIRPNKMDWKVFDRSKPIPTVYSINNFSAQQQSNYTFTENVANTEPPLPPSYEDFKVSYKYPEEVMHPHETIVRQKLPDYITVGDYFELIVAEVYDPSKFWIQIRGPDTFDALNVLMDEMQTFYIGNAESFKLNEASVQEGLFVAALFMHEYHRAKIIKVFSDSTIKVYYIDYGTVAEVFIKQTCFLHKQFAVLPQQAVRCRLHNIIPVEQNTMWPRGASKFMLNMIKEKVLYGLIRLLEEKDYVLNLILTDTTTPGTDIHVNDELVKFGYAVLGSEAHLCITSNAIVPNVHLYPTFDEIEEGVYPSVSDLIRLLKLGQTYDMIFHGYFLHDPNCTLNTTAQQNDTNTSFDYNTSLEQNFSTESHTDETQNISEKDKISDTSLGSILSSNETLFYNNTNEQLKQNVNESRSGIYQFNLNKAPQYETQQPYNFNNPSPREPIGFTKPPPGFENVIPDINNFVPYTQINNSMLFPPSAPVDNSIISFNNYSATPSLNDFNVPVNWDSILLNAAISNPILFQQVLLQREMCLQQNRAAILQKQNEALLQQQKEEEMLQQQKILSQKIRQKNKEQLANNFCELQRSIQMQQKSEIFQNQAVFQTQTVEAIFQHQKTLLEQIQQKNKEQLSHNFLEMQKFMQRQQKTGIFQDQNPALFQQQTGNTILEQQQQAFLQQLQQKNEQQFAHNFHELQRGIQMQQNTGIFQQNTGIFQPQQALLQQLQQKNKEQVTQNFIELQNFVQKQQNQLQQLFYNPPVSDYQSTENNSSSFISLVSSQENYPELVTNTSDYTTESIKSSLNPEANEFRLPSNQDDYIVPNNQTGNTPKHVDNELDNKTETNVNCTFETDKNVINQTEINDAVPKMTEYEHISERFVKELEFGSYLLHVLKIEDVLYVASQELLKNLLNTNLTFKCWMKSKNITASNFPNKLLNLTEHEDLCKELKKYTIPGVYQANNLGCIIRVTPLTDVKNIVHKFGSQNIIPEFEASIQNIECPNSWKTLNLSD